MKKLSNACVLSKRFCPLIAFSLYFRYQEALQEGFHAMGHDYETKEYDPMEPTEDGE